MATMHANKDAAEDEHGIGDCYTVKGNDELSDSGSDINEINEEHEVAYLAICTQAPFLERKNQKDCQIFVNKLDKRAVDDDLIEVFSAFGDIHSVNIVKNPVTQQSKGFGFVRYGSAEHAKKALAELKNGVQVKGKWARVCANQDNDTLYLGNICKTWSKDKVLDVLKGLGIDQIDHILLPEDPMIEGTIKGFAFLEFSSHSDAMAAYHRLTKPDAVFGRDISAKVAFTSSLNPTEEAILQVKTVYVEGIPRSWSEGQVEEVFKKYGEVKKVKLPLNFFTNKRKGTGFVEFASRESAVACVEGINDAQFGEVETKFKVMLAKPHNKGKLAKMRPRGGFKVIKDREVAEESDRYRNERKAKLKEDKSGSQVVQPFEGKKRGVSGAAFPNDGPPKKPCRNINHVNTKPVIYVGNTPIGLSNACVTNGGSSRKGHTNSNHDKDTPFKGKRSGVSGATLTNAGPPEKSRGNINQIMTKPVIYVGNTPSGPSNACATGEGSSNGHTNMNHGRMHGTPSNASGAKEGLIMKAPTNRKFGNMHDSPSNAYDNPRNTCSGSPEVDYVAHPTANISTHTPSTVNYKAHVGMIDDSPSSYFISQRNTFAGNSEVDYVEHPIRYALAYAPSTIGYQAHDDVRTYHSTLYNSVMEPCTGYILAANRVRNSHGNDQRRTVSYVNQLASPGYVRATSVVQPSLMETSGVSLGVNSIVQPYVRATYIEQPSLGAGAAITQPSLPSASVRATSIGQPSLRAAITQPSLPLTSVRATSIGQPSLRAAIAQPSLPSTSVRATSIGQPSLGAGAAIAQPSLPSTSVRATYIGQPSLGAVIAQPSLPSTSVRATYIRQSSLGAVIAQPSLPSVRATSIGQPSPEILQPSLPSTSAGAAIAQPSLPSTSAVQESLPSTSMLQPPYYAYAIYDDYEDDYVYPGSGLYVSRQSYY